ncbi:hypothetical protein ACFVGY_29420 [Streptomyces sp. NPDC127106]|uniref:hypothetical protein n=1 Tax=Streptomyces sp. NPDC127106 TaxID=3345360 RepID=UPI00363D8830
MPVRAAVRAAVLPLAVPVVALLLAGCGESGGLVSAGAAPTASGPVQLWPGRKGATVPPADPAGAPAVYVPGLPPVRGQNVHEVDPIALVRAEVAAGSAGIPPQTAAAIASCGREPAGACPVLTPYYRDLTGNGRDELVVGIDLPDGMMSVRVYTADRNGLLNRIMATTESVVGVELAGRDVILRVPSGNPGYELITAWSWDSKERTMLPTREQIVRLPQASPQTSPSAQETQPAPGAHS